MASERRTQILAIGDSLRADEDPCLPAADAPHRLFAFSPPAAVAGSSAASDRVASAAPRAVHLKPLMTNTLRARRARLSRRQSFAARVGLSSLRVTAIDRCVGFDLRVH